MDGTGITCVDGRWPAGTITVAQHDADAAPDIPAADLESWGEADLVAACLEGRRGAFDVIVVRHRRAVYQLCYRFVRNHEDASDLSQEVFLRAYRSLRTFKGHASIGTWLYRIAVNLCLNKVSSRGRRTEPIDGRTALPAPGPDAASRLISAERADAVRAAIARLPPTQRATLILRVYQELPHREIARVLGSSVGAAKANFFHALNNLRRLLGEEPT